MIAPFGSTAPKRMIPVDQSEIPLSRFDHCLHRGCVPETNRLLIAKTDRTRKVLRTNDYFLWGQENAL